MSRRSKPDNIRLCLTVNINVGSLSLAEEMNDPNIRLRLMVINVGSLSFAAEVNDRNIRLRLTVKLNVGSLSLAEEVNDCNIRLHWILVGTSLHLFPDHCFVDNCRRRDEI